MKRIQSYNKINGIIKRNFGKQMFSETKIVTYNIAAKTTLKYVAEAKVKVKAKLSLCFN